MPPPTPPPAFAIYLSSVEGHAVARFGTASNGRPNELIGAVRMKGGAGITWNTKAITPLTEREFGAYRREYMGAIAEKALTVRTEDDYRARVKEQEERAKAMLKEQADEAAKAAEASKAEPVKEPA